MQNYVTQLLSDLENAKKNVPPPVDYALLYPNHPAIDYGLSFIVEWEMGPDCEMDDLFGIKAEQLPPPDQLTEEQAEQLVIAILDLWAAFNMVASLPDEDMPALLIYKVLQNRWKTSPTRYMSEGTTHIEFCHYEPEQCPWGMEFCSCKEFINESMDDYKPSDNELLKGAARGDDGSIRWVNPKLLDENGNFNPSKLDGLWEE